MKRYDSVKAMIDDLNNFKNSNAQNACFVAAQLEDWLQEKYRNTLCKMPRVKLELTVFSLKLSIGDICVFDNNDGDGYDEFMFLTYDKCKEKYMNSIDALSFWTRPNLSQPANGCFDVS